MERLPRLLPYLLVGAVGASLYWASDRFEFAGQPGRIGPEVWPKLVIILLIAASLAGLVQALLAAPAEHQDDVPLGLPVPGGLVTEETPVPPIEKPSAARVLAGIGILVGFVVLIETAGFFITCFATLFAMMQLGGYRRPVPSGLIALAGAAVFFFVFQRVVYISLPLGVGPFSSFSQFVMAAMGVR